jgi:hypothetical protein
MSTDFSRAAGIRIQIPKSILTVLNQLYEVEQKLKKSDSATSIGRNLAKMKDALGEEGLPGQDADGGQTRITLAYEDPMGQPYKETRTDVEATVSGDRTENLVVVEVIKPIIRAFWKDGQRENSRIVQQGVVIVASRKVQAEP